MPIMFNAILREAKLPLSDVRLIRHKDKRASGGRTPHELWRDSPAQFELYQSIQGIRNRKKVAAPFWAVFVVNLNDETMFAGIYAVKYRGLLKKDTPQPLSFTPDSCVSFTYVSAIAKPVAEVKLVPGNMMRERPRFWHFYNRCRRRASG
jgi:hypothetical protein